MSMEVVKIYFTCFDFFHTSRIQVNLENISFCSLIISVKLDLCIMYVRMYVLCMYVCRPMYLFICLFIYLLPFSLHKHAVRIWVSGICLNVLRNTRSTHS